MNIYKNGSSLIRYCFPRIIVIMKFSFLILITLSLQISIAANAQKISLSEKNASLEDVLKKITLQSGSNFLYTSQMLENNNPGNFASKRSC